MKHYSVNWCNVRVGARHAVSLIIVLVISYGAGLVFNHYLPLTVDSLLAFNVPVIIVGACVMVMLLVATMVAYTTWLSMVRMFNSVFDFFITTEYK